MSTDISREAAEATEDFRVYMTPRHSFDRDSPAETRLRFLVQQAIKRATAALREERDELKAEIAQREILEAESVSERNELRAECERLRSLLNSANQQQQDL